jgi:hypothetical protein
MTRFIDTDTFAHTLREPKFAAYLKSTVGQILESMADHVNKNLTRQVQALGPNLLKLPFFCFCPLLNLKKKMACQTGRPSKNRMRTICSSGFLIAFSSRVRRGISYATISPGSFI